VCVSICIINTIKSILKPLGDNNILHGSSKIIHSSNDIREIIMDNSTKKRIDNVLVNVHSNLNHTSGDTIMLLEYIKLFQKYSNTVTIVTYYNIGPLFRSNLDLTNIKIVENMETFSYIETHYNKHDLIFLRNHNTNDKIIGKPYLNKTVLYGLDTHLESIAKMDNKFLFIITQSEKIKQKYMDKSIMDDKIIVKEPQVEKYEFDLPERKDNEIRLIYCGTLRDEENILEIIEEFQKIHKERPEVVLKIVYGKIMNTNADFEKKVNEYIKNGVDGITFKHNLSHKDACYEIATSDIGICWRKPGYGDNGEVSTKVKEYEMYGVIIFKNNIFLDHNIIKTIIKINFIEQIFLNKFLDSMLEMKLNYDSNTKLYPYILHNCFPYDYGGYAARSHNILCNFNKMYPDKKYFVLARIGYPYDIHSKSQAEIDFIKKIDNVFYLVLPKLNYPGKYYYTKPEVSENIYYIFLDLLFYIFNIKTFHVASAYKNAMPIIKYCKSKNITSIYETRGMWHITGGSRDLLYNNKIMHDFTEYCESEKFCIQNCSKPLFITNQLQEYATNITKYNEFKSLNCKIKKHPIFWNCFEITERIEKKKTDKFIIGYVGSIVFYEGIVEAIDSIEKIITKYNKSVEFHLVGNIEAIINEIKKLKGEDISSIFKKPFIKLYGRVPHDEVINIISKFDLYIIPRLDLPVTNIVSPIKPFEPMSLKIPLLMSDCDCLKDISKNGENCMLFKKGEFDDFNEKVKYIIDNGYPEDILENGYNFVKNERNWKFMIEQIGLYDMLD